MKCYYELSFALSIDIKKDESTFFVDLNFSSLEPTFQYSIEAKETNRLDKTLLFSRLGGIEFPRR